MAIGTTRSAVPHRRGVVAAWALYDWANSAFTTLVVTFVYSAYFTKAIAVDEITGTAQWSWAVSLSGLLIALLSPLLGAMADHSGHRLRYLLTSTWVCCLATAGMAFAHPEMEQVVFLTLALFVIANVAFELGMVFYNAFLPEIAPPERLGRVSGQAWGLGYIGGLLCLVVALAVLVRDEPLFGISTEAGFNFRAVNLLVVGWFLIFSLPLFVLAPAQPARSGDRLDLRAVYREFVTTLSKMRKYTEITKFLLARLFYNDGLVTAFAFGGIYAAGTFGLSLSEVIQFGIAINVVAGIGAWSFGFLDDRLGGKTTILVTLVALSACSLLAVWAPSVEWLWVAGMGIGFFAGPNQSAGRSLMARFTPERHTTEFFGFFAFSGKITTFAGPLLLGVVTEATQNQRAGLATVVLFLVVGGGLLLMVNEKLGIAQSQG